MQSLHLASTSAIKQLPAGVCACQAQAQQPCSQDSAPVVSTYLTTRPDADCTDVLSRGCMGAQESPTLRSAGRLKPRNLAIDFNEDASDADLEDNGAETLAACAMQDLATGADLSLLQLKICPARPFSSFRLRAGAVSCKFLAVSVKHMSDSML